MAAPDEIIAFTDADNNILGFKPFKDFTDADTWRLASIWVENTKGQVLLQQRSLDKVLAPGCWTPAAEGTVTKDDSFMDTAIRELYEEIGLSGVELTPIKLSLCRMEFGNRQMQTYKTICDWPVEQFIIQKEEVAQIAWIDKQTLVDEITGKKPHSRPYPTSIKYWANVFDLV